MASYLDILCAVVALLLILYYYSTSTYDFWKKRGVPGPKPLPLVGNTKDLMLAKVASTQLVTDIYKKYANEPLVGFFANRMPVLLVKDLELIKDVLIKDFTKFSDRGFNVHERTEPMSTNLLFLETERWRPLRTKFSPTFTSGKLKEMLYLIIDCSVDLERNLKRLVAKGEPINCREMAAKFTTDVIGTCAFGIDMSVSNQVTEEFHRMGKLIFAVNFENTCRIKVRQFLPWFYDLLGYVLPDRILAPYFTKNVMDTIKYRQQNDIFRPDFVNTLIELRNHPEKMENIELTDSFLASQAFVFFAAGFETSSSGISHTLYELARNHDVQDKLRQEIKEMYAKTGGEMKYEHIKGMKYLDKVFKETLRKYPPGSVLSRKATSVYTFNGTNVTIPKKTMVWIPVYSIQMDPDIFPNPEVFDPERFNEETEAARHPMHYLPFGDGPRNCIGARFGQIQTKIGLITILREHKVDVCEKTIIPYERDPGAFLLTPKGGVYLKITKADS
ncbi:probable cytochrome P450 6a14 [Hylaeus anthracinus]|uniref:probable cytochrome P450 6a14 n=1 Tax=Hylaeus anthracinus TaxID=313031 RepID=UPI0023B9206A|nr:probable cytochrome P450 6a14 [Hylaeus anthracinus]